MSVGGRPRKYDHENPKDVQRLIKNINDYFLSIYDKRIVRNKDGDIERDEDDKIIYEEYLKEAPTWLGLAIYLGVTKETLRIYQQIEQFSVPLKLAKDKMEHYSELCLYDKDRRNPTGIIFSLKNNFGWQDTRTIENNINASLTIKQELHQLSDAELEQRRIELERKLGIQPIIEVESTEIIE